ncbi:HupE/UreJ family protein [Uliginosibacterium sp. H3]|uniref:HupE/UreJ family protein n=1 Tax=Uliginosibacterium silvisoli TaxID=3114758 RepID=A0ABU6K4I2_9RHOO|nr:HupE/UreJ family protein [Uliginosibacterium sp. H3]
MTKHAWRALVAIITACVLSSAASAHGFASRDAGFVASTAGFDPLPYAYLGARHMLTGYDHLLFIFAVLFFVFSARQVLLYVTLFSLGHSLTLLLGVYLHWQFNAHVVDAFIALSVIWKALDNLGGFRAFGWQPDNRIVIPAFGLIHGLGLATSLQSLQPSAQGLLPNLLAFNVGVELGQLLALIALLGVFALWRQRTSFSGSAIATNTLVLTAGVVLLGYQLTAATQLRI